MALEKLFPQGSPRTPLQGGRVLKSEILDLRVKDIESVIKSTELVDPGWYAYHAKVMRQIGPTRYLELADKAKTGGNPQTLFSYLLKQELR